MSNFAIAANVLKVSENRHLKRNSKFTKGCQWCIAVDGEFVFLKRRRQMEKYVKTCVENAMSLRELCKAYDALQMLQGSLPDRNYTFFDSKRFPYFRCEDALLHYTNSDWKRLFSMIEQSWRIDAPYYIVNGYLHDKNQLTRVQEDNLGFIEDLT